MLQRRRARPQACISFFTSVGSANRRRHSAFDSKYEVESTSPKWRPRNDSRARCLHGEPLFIKEQLAKGIYAAALPARAPAGCRRRHRCGCRSRPRRRSLTGKRFDLASDELTGKSRHEHFLARHRPPFSYYQVHSMSSASAGEDAASVIRMVRPCRFCADRAALRREFPSSTFQ